MFFKACQYTNRTDMWRGVWFPPEHSSRHHICVVDIKASRGCGCQWNAVYTQFHDALSYIVSHIDVYNRIHKLMNTDLVYFGMELKLDLGQETRCSVSSRRTNIRLEVTCLMGRDVRSSRCQQLCAVEQITFTEEVTLHFAN